MPAVTEVFFKYYNIWLITWSNIGAAKTAAQAWRRSREQLLQQLPSSAVDLTISARFSPHWFSGSLNYVQCCQSSSCWLQSQGDLLHHDLAYTIDLSKSLCIHTVNLTADCPSVQSDELLEIRSEEAKRCTWRE